MDGEKLMEDRYLGDGVYASYDGYAIGLDLRAQGTREVKIWLEPEVLKALNWFVADIKKEHDQATEVPA